MSDDIEKAEKKFGHLIVIACVLILTIAIVIAALISPWIAERLQSDFWPIDKSSISPNIVASGVQVIIVTLVLSICYPPFRKAIEKWVLKHKNEMKTHITNEIKEHTQNSSAEIHKKFDTLFEHLDVQPPTKKDKK